MKNSEQFALDHYLSCYPKDKSFDEVLKMFHDKSSDIVVWKPYEHYDALEIIRLIGSMVNDIEKQFFPFHELVTVIDRDSVSETFFQVMSRKPSDDELTRLCSYLDTDFSYTLPSRIANAVALLNIKN